MSANDDDDLEHDDKLDAMRTVWLSMRDEEPSDNGLASLMAAAREKADTMAAPPRESFWQKVLAMFRRPPVLALASVAVLLGGALFVANRRDKMESAPAVSSDQKQTADEIAPPPPEKENAAPASATITEQTGAAGSAAAIEAPPPPPPPQVAKDPVARPRGERRPQTTRPEPPVVTQKPPANPTMEKDEKPMVKAGGGLASGSLDNESAPMPPPAPTPGTTSLAPGRRDEATTAPTADVGVDATSTTKDAGGERTRVLQLVKQCESAAARGDCAAVKVLAAKIRSTDADAYRQRVVKNTSIARCLE